MGKPAARMELMEKKIEGKTAREAASALGKERVSNERERMSQSFRSSRNKVWSLLVTFFRFPSCSLLSAIRVSFLNVETELEA